MAVEFIEGDLPSFARSADLQAEVAALIEELKARPMQWAVVESYPEDPNKAHRRREAIRKYGADVLEVRVQIPDVYARYVGIPEVPNKGEEAEA